MCIKAGRNQDQLWIKTVGSMSQYLPEDRLIDLIAGCCRQWNVDGSTQSRPFSTFIGGACTGIERGLVGGKIEHAWIRIKNVLGAVAMMHIIVNDHHSLKAITVKSVLCRHCYVIEETEAHRFVR